MVSALSVSNCSRRVYSGFMIQVEVTFLNKSDQLHEYHMFKDEALRMS